MPWSAAEGIGNKSDKHGMSILQERVVQPIMAVRGSPKYFPQLVQPQTRVSVLLRHLFFRSSTDTLVCGWTSCGKYFFKSLPSIREGTPTGLHPPTSPI